MILCCSHLSCEPSMNVPQLKFQATALVHRLLLSPKNRRESLLVFLKPLLRQQCWKLLGPCWQWCANGCNNSKQRWKLLRSCWQWCPNGRNNSKQCWDNNVGSCCALVGSGVQTDAQLTTMLEPAVHCGKDTTYKTSCL